MRICCWSLLALAACSTAPRELAPRGEKPPAWEGPRHGLQRSCDTTLVLEQLVARGTHEKSDFTLPDQVGDPLPQPPDALLRYQVQEVLSAASCDHTSTPDTRMYLTRTLLRRAVYVTAASAEQRGAYAASMDLVRLWAVATSRRTGSISDIGVGQDIEAAVLDGLDRLEGQLTEGQRTRLAADIDEVVARRPRLDLDGELWNGWFARVAPPGCYDAAQDRIRQIDAAWDAMTLPDDLPLENTPFPTGGELLFEPSLYCTRFADQFTESVAAIDAYLASRVATLRTRLDR